MKRIWKKINSGDNKLSFKQTSKQVWYCDTMDIYCNDLKEGVGLAELVIDAINKMLARKNKVIKEEAAKKEVKPKKETKKNEQGGKKPIL